MSDDSNRAPPQGGVIEGSNPSEYNPTDPIVIFIIQAGLIIIICHLLHWPLSKIRQPRVIAEVIGGIILGPSVMGRIPGFRDAIFPAESIPNLTLVANLGLVLYLFIIGLETDVAFLLSNWRVATSVSVAGLALPFGIGCALAWGVYNEFANDEGILHIEFPIYMLFVGVAIAITAFPVLCRILTELKLLDTPVGVITLSAGVANDVVGWILLALCVALANAGTGLSALYILLACAGYMIFLLYAVKPALAWLLRRTGNIENGPSQSMISLILLIALASAFFTAIIGVHAIFGGFMVGLILPRERNFNIKVLEKLEDLIGALFLPLYFTLSGLKTDIGLLDNGMTWAYVIAVTFSAFFSKIIGATLAARLNGLVWRESFTIGALMSCKGLVELIVLNIGLQARILSTRTFTIFVVMALLTTFATTPLVSFLYPPSYQKKLAAWKRGEIDWDTGLPPTTGPDGSSSGAASHMAFIPRVRRMLIYLRLDNMPATLDLVSLFGLQSGNDPRASSSEGVGSSDEKRAVPGHSQPEPTPVRAHGLRLLQLGDRESNVVTVSQVQEYSRNDPLVNIFRTVGQFLRMSVSGEVAVMPESRFAEALLTKSADTSSDLIIVPWSERGNLGDSLVPVADDNSSMSSPYTQFASTILDSKVQSVALFLPHRTGVGSKDGGELTRPRTNRAYSFRDLHDDMPFIPVTNQSHHIFLPFFGGRDDEFALSLVMQLCEQHDVSATVVHFTSSGVSPAAIDVAAHVTAHAQPAAARRIIVDKTTADKGAQAALSRALIELRPDEGGITWHNLIVVGRNAENRNVGGSGLDEMKRTVGAIAAHLMSSNVKADILAVQAKSSA